jgi:predicted nucleic acid-binding protein
VAALADLSAPLLTTWPVFTEAMYLVGEAGGWKAQAALWAITERKLLTIVDLPGGSVERSRALMAKYADVPMSLADATLVSLAEMRNVRRVFTLDSDFTVYRFRGRSAFLLIPSRG